MDIIVNDIKIVNHDLSKRNYGCPSGYVRTNSVRVQRQNSIIIVSVYPKSHLQYSPIFSLKLNF